MILNYDAFKGHVGPIRDTDTPPPLTPEIIEEHRRLHPEDYDPDGSFARLLAQFPTPPEKEEEQKSPD